MDPGLVAIATPAKPRRNSRTGSIQGRRLAAAVAGLTISANLGSLYVLFATGFLDRYRGPATTQLDVALVYVSVCVLAAATVSYVTVGVLLASRPDSGTIAWILLAGGALLAASTFGYIVGGELVYHQPSAATANAILLLGPLAIGPGYTLVLPGLALAFPTGGLPSQRWRLPVGALAGLVAAGSVIGLLAPGPIAPQPRGSHNPFGLEAMPAILQSAAYPAVVAGIAGLTVLGAAAVVSRYRGGNATLRQQLRWFLAAVLLAAVPVSTSILPGAGPSAWVALAGLGLLLLPASVGIAVTRYRLYEIDVIINRALVYGVLGALVAAAYVILATMLSRLAGGGNPTETATLATVAAALVALAARQVVQRAVARLLYGWRGDPLAVFRRVARRLEGAGTPEGLLVGVVDDLRTSLKLQAIAVYDSDGALLAGDTDGRAGIRVPLSHQGQPVGELLVSTGRGDALRSSDLRLFQDIGPQLAVAIEAVRLKRDLQRARERLVTMLEEERRRIRRDLHDGLGPTLTAIALRADAAANLLPTNPTRARALLGELRAASGDAIAEVRQLTHGLRPVALDELGLVGAIRERAMGLGNANATGPVIVVECASELPSLPAAAEVAAYRIAVEAITNVIRHADARHCLVRIEADTGLEVEVSDDGIGWDGRERAGIGVRSMLERAADLGGALTITRGTGGGTRIHAVLPLGGRSAT